MRLLGGVVLALLLAGCASVDTVRNAQGQGVKRTFRQSYDVVYAAALASAARRRLEVVEQDRATGRILLSSGASWGSLGERIAIFVTRAGSRATLVEIVSKPVLSTVTFPPDWPVWLFGDIEEELTPSRVPK